MDVIKQIQQSGVTFVGGWKTTTLRMATIAHEQKLREEGDNNIMIEPNLP